MAHIRQYPPPPGYCVWCFAHFKTNKRVLLPDNDIYMHKSIPSLILKCKQYGQILSKYFAIHSEKSGGNQIYYRVFNKHYCIKQAMLFLTSSKSLRKLLKIGTNSILVISQPRTNASSWIENANVLRTFHCKPKIMGGK